LGAAVHRTIGSLLKEILSQVFSKLGAGNRVEGVTNALRDGLLHL